MDQSRGVFTKTASPPSRFDPNQAHGCVTGEGVEDAHGVTAAPNTRDHIVGHATGKLLHLLARLTADDRLEVAHDERIGMRPDNGANQVEGSVDVAHPVAECLVDGIFERGRAIGDGNHPSAQ